jgi:septum formation protein
MERIILASASPRRKELLEQIGVKFDIFPSVEEEIITKTEPKEIVKELAHQKAFDVFQKQPKADVIIGADTIVVYDGIIMGKPKDEKDAVRMLQMLQGNTHQVYTGVSILINKSNNTQEILFAETTKVTMYPMTEEEILSYVQTKEPMDKAGAYGIQGLSAIYVKAIEGDYYNVVGLPVGRLYQELMACKIRLNMRAE